MSLSQTTFKPKQTRKIKYWLFLLGKKFWHNLPEYKEGRFTNEIFIKKSSYNYEVKRLPRETIFSNNQDAYLDAKIRQYKATVFSSLSVDYSSIKIIELK